MMMAMTIMHLWNHLLRVDSGSLRRIVRAAKKEKTAKAKMGENLRIASRCKYADFSSGNMSA